MDFHWKAAYEELAKTFLEQHFVNAQGVASAFPCMRDEYKWGAHRPTVSDSRVPAKNNIEYHGLERLAAQFHLAGQYDYAYQHWLLAASWRRSDMNENAFNDPGHDEAIEYCIKQALFNRTLHDWQREGTTLPAPVPESFELTETDLAEKDLSALQEIEEHMRYTENR